MIDSLRGWTPVHVALHEPRIDWAVVTASPRQAFFTQDVGDAMRRPFNLLFARKTTYDVLHELAGAGVAREPAGIVFHMSRCGSTVITQMLAQIESLVVLSEPQPFDGAIRRDDERALRGLARAFDPGHGRRFVIKLHAWHVLELPLIRRAFPNAPWLFVFREPRAVLASQERSTGPELLPGTIPAPLLAPDACDAASPDYGARVVAALCRAALRHANDGRALFIDHSELPDAVASRVLPFFGIAPTPSERAAMQRVATQDAKRPGVAFAADRAAVSSGVDAVARRWLDEPYAALRDVSARAAGAR